MNFLSKFHEGQPVTIKYRKVPSAHFSPNRFWGNLIILESSRFINEHIFKVLSYSDIKRYEGLSIFEFFSCDGILVAILVDILVQTVMICKAKHTSMLCKEFFELIKTIVDDVFGKMPSNKIQLILFSESFCGLGDSNGFGRRCEWRSELCNHLLLTGFRLSFPDGGTRPHSQSAYPIFLLS